MFPIPARLPGPNQVAGREIRREDSDRDRELKAPLHFNRSRSPVLYFIIICAGSSTPREMRISSM